MPTLTRVTLSLLLVATTFAACAPTPEPPRGTVLETQPSPDFSLTDQHGQMVSLGDWRGKIVVLTFLYANCQDECPLIAARLRKAHDLLGADSGRVTFVAISTDPEGDTPEAIARFLHEQRVEDVLVYLRGTRAELVPLWKAYYVAAERVGVVTTGHVSRILLIDAAGNQRIHLSATSAEAEDVAHDVRVLLATSARIPSPALVARCSPSAETSASVRLIAPDAPDASAE